MSNPVLLLHDPATLTHKTIELLGAKLIPAVESPERISAILATIQASRSHGIKTINFTPDSSSAPEFLQVLSSTHDAGYLDHLEHVHASWVTEGLIEQHESILPECFPFPHSSAALSHEKAYTDPPRDIFARAGFYAFDMSTGICAETWPSALASAHLAFYGVQALFPSPDRHVLLEDDTTPPSTALALCRPPGHHCDTRRAGGYCYLNNAVVAVETFRRFSYPLTSQPQPNPSHAPDDSSTPSSPPRRTAILDLDFHHGNGTQETFYTDPHVLYISIHGQDEYPYYTGSATETGASSGHGMNLNLPLPAGSSVQQYLTELDVGLDALVSFRPEFVLLSLGFDTFHLDPLGSFRIETEDYAAIAGRVRERLKALPMEAEGGGFITKLESVPCLILLEGGYVIDKLGTNLLSFLKGWEGV